MNFDNGYCVVLHSSNSVAKKCLFLGNASMLYQFQPNPILNESLSGVDRKDASASK